MPGTYPSEAGGRRTYVIGLVLALILTAIPFGLVVAGWLPRLATLVVIAVAAVIQIFVHLHYYLHMDLRHTPKENIFALAFAAVLIFVMIGGTLWIMFDLHNRMQL